MRGLLRDQDRHYQAVCHEKPGDNGCRSREEIGLGATGHQPRAAAAAQPETVIAGFLDQHQQYQYESQYDLEYEEDGLHKFRD